MPHRIFTRYGKIFISRWSHVAVIIILSLVIFYDKKPIYDERGIHKAIEHTLRNESSHLDIPTIDITALARFYEDREYAPVWFKEGSLSAEAAFIIDLVSRAEEEGLSSNDYNLGLINKKVVKATSQAKTDIYLSAIFTRYIDHIRNSRIDKDILNELWPQHPSFIDPYEWLQHNAGSNRLLARLFELSPPHYQYERLRNALAQLRIIKRKGGWPTLPLDSLLKPGQRDSRVKILKQRLIISKDLDPQFLDGDLYDDKLRKAVTNFQRRHGILADGLAGEESIRAMNVSVDQRMRQIMINMERWRLMQRDLGTRHILVNSAGFELIGVDEKEITLQMRVIVGETDLATPVFSAPITKIIVNPEWHVPRSISSTELLPKVQKNPNYFRDNDFIAYRVDANKKRTIFDPDEIDWNSLSEQYFPYEVVQKAGEKNPLGRMKFFIPNFHSIYLHDTQQRHLFDHVFRNLSHGCIRLQNPKALMRYLLKYDSIWRNESINSAWESEKTRTIELKNRVPVHIFYFTTWIDDNGSINFYPDVYGYDERIATLLM